MEYEIRAIRYARCDAIESALFADSTSHQTQPLALYVWIITGGPQPVIVDPGPDAPGLAQFSKEVAHICPGGVPAERDMLEAVRSTGIHPDEVRHVLITHLHFDHFAGIKGFPNAQVVVSRTGLLEAIAPSDGSRPYLPKEFMLEMAHGWPDRVHAATDQEEILPGISVLRIGGHSPCNQAIIVATSRGKVALPGDTVMLYRNIEEDRPVGIGDPEECARAMRILRDQADIVVPSHDPKVLRQYPDGRIP